MSIEADIKTKGFRHEYSKASINLFFTSNWLGDYHRKFFKRYDLTHPQYNILRILRGQNGNPANINLLKERMLDKMSNVSRIIERLKKKKLITLNISSKDKRVVEVYLSEEGTSLLNHIEKGLEDLNNILLHMNVDELVTLNTLLDKVRNPEPSQSTLLDIN